MPHMYNSKLQPLPVLPSCILNADGWSLENDEFKKIQTSCYRSQHSSDTC